MPGVQGACRYGGAARAEVLRPATDRRGQLQAGDQAELGERLGRLDDAAQRLVHAVAQLVGQARVEGQQLDVPERQRELVAQEVLEPAGGQQHVRPAAPGSPLPAAPRSAS